MPTLPETPIPAPARRAPTRKRDRSKTAIDPMTLLDSPRELAAQMYRRALARPNVPPETLLDIGVLVGMISQMVEPQKPPPYSVS